MNDNEVKTVQMTAEEAAQYAAFKAEQERKAAADKARKDRKVYGQMVDEEIEQALPMLRELSGDIRTVKEQVLDNFRQILDMKADVLKRTKDGQKATRSPIRRATSASPSDGASWTAGAIQSRTASPS